MESSISWSETMAPGSRDLPKEQLCNLPEQLVTEILLKLPIKSLIQCKTLSKFWNNFIGGNDFIHTHYNHHTNHPRLLVHHHIYPDNFYARDRLGFSIFPDETLVSHQHLHFPPDFPKSLKVFTIGPVNGLLLLHGFSNDFGQIQRGAVIFNPATRQFKKLKVPCGSELLSNVSVCSLKFGFGFDSATNDYKIIAFREIKDGVSDPVLVYVYSLANDSWRHVECFISEEEKSLLVHECSSTSYFNGAFHWLFLDGINGYSILSFDMSKETFSVIKGPENPMSKQASFFSMYKKDNFLAMFLYPMHHNPFMEFEYIDPMVENIDPMVENIDLMVMKKYGRWEKHLSIDASFIRDMDYPLGLWKDNKLLFETVGKQLRLYDPYTHKTEQFDINNIGGMRSLQIFYCKESLVSVVGGSRISKKYAESDDCLVNVGGMQQ